MAAVIAWCIDNDPRPIGRCAPTDWRFESVNGGDRGEVAKWQTSDNSTALFLGKTPHALIVVDLCL
jgi:hypothetical protein